jgi:methanethiol S-methyltransferase
MTAAATAVLVIFWQPIPITLWRIEALPAVVGITALYLAIWGMMFAATFHFGHLGFFGLAQAWARVRARPAPEAPFASRWLYGIVRHPFSLGWMLAWVTPHLTVGQLVIAICATAYVLAATGFEEADLIEALGDRYRAYRTEVPAFLPRLRRASAAGSETPLTGPAEN